MGRRQLLIPGHEFLRLLVIAIVAFTCLAGLGRHPLTETDEGFAANRADSFFRHGSPLLSYDDVDDDGPQFRKPPVLYWCVAALYPVLGRNLYAVRLPTALASFLLLLWLSSLAREHLGEWCALWSAVLPLTVPFVLLHVRTAMLDLPLLLLVLLSVRLFSDRSRRASRASLSGAVAGGALLLKGAAGLVAVYAPPLFALVTRGADARWLRNSILSGLAALGCVAAFVVALPPPYQRPWLAGIFWQESVGRLVGHYTIWDRLHHLVRPLLEDLRWHIPAALVSLPLLAWQSIRDRRAREWIALALIVSAPFVLGGLKLPESFPRYFLVVDLFLLTLTPFFALRVLDSPLHALLLLPFALLSFRLEQSGWQWVPTLSALGAFCLANLRAVRERDGRRYAVATLLVVSITVPSHFSEVAGLHSIGMMHTFPEVVPLAKKAQELVLPDEKLVVGWGFTNHTILFYGRRSLETFHHWLLSSIEPDAVRYAIFRDAGEPQGIPGLEISLVDSSPPWRLVRLQVSSAVESGSAILMPRPLDRPDRIAETLRLLGVVFERFPKGFVLRPLVDRKEVWIDAVDLSVNSRGSSGQGSVVSEASRPLVIGKGEDLYVRLEREVSLGGLELFPASKYEDMTGLRIEAYDRRTESWLALKAVEKPFEPTLRLTGGRIEETSVWALRARFDPVVTSGLRILRTAERPLRVHSVSVGVTPEAVELRGPA
jgi:4-amino-4-deoxy-L-arabinose transferase-like glycosyltransferase